jgi:RND superfamily putative drug exporter
VSTQLYRLARWCVRRRRTVVATWLLVLIALGVAFGLAGSRSTDEISIPGTESQKALDALASDFPAASGAAGTVVFAAPEGESLTSERNRSLVLAATRQAGDVPGVVGAVDPYRARALSPDGRYALLSVQFSDPVDALTAQQVEDYERIGSAAERAGLRVEHGGDPVQPEVEVGSGEVLGVGVALVVLVITLGSLVAAGMTMLNALAGVGAGMLSLMLVSHVVDFNSTTPVLALMLGLAVGIDYSLFITSRHRQNLGAGLPVDEAAARAVGTAGSAVVFAGLTVIIALSALSVVGIPFLGVMGVTAAFAVLVAVLVALTLLPALLGFLGDRVRGRTPGRGARHREAFGFRWAQMVLAHRVVAAVAAVVALGVVAIPTLQMRLALPDGSTAPTGTAQRDAYDLVSEGFGPGFNGQLATVVFGRDAAGTEELAGRVAQQVQRLDGVVTVAPPQLNRSGDVAVIGVIPAAGPTSEQTQDLVDEIRSTVRPLAAEAGTGADVAVTGSTAVGIDVSEKLSSALPVYLALVVGLSFLLLMLVFRSVLVPLKATLGFLLSVGAAFGATVAVFQWGWLAGLVGLSGEGPLISFLPVLLVGILFGLAMDYEVFLVSRMREDFVHTGSAEDAVVSGVGHGARVVTAAAVIMTSVFAGFAFSPDPTIKAIGFGLAVGVFIDAFVVRMFLVPAVMGMLGSSAWWLPGWLDRLLPHADIEGAGMRTQAVDAPGSVDQEEPEESEELVTVR